MKCHDLSQAKLVENALVRFIDLNCWQDKKAWLNEIKSRCWYQVVSYTLQESIKELQIT